MRIPSVKSRPRADVDSLLARTFFFPPRIGRVYEPSSFFSSSRLYLEDFPRRVKFVFRVTDFNKLGWILFLFPKELFSFLAIPEVRWPFFLPR